MKREHIEAFVQQHLDEIVAAVEDDDCLGYCVSCGDQADGVEPDARRYECHACGAFAVYGAEELLMYGG